MINKNISILIICIFIFLSLFNNLYLYNSFNKLKNVNHLNYINNKWYEIKNSSLFINYPEFINNSDKYIPDILFRYDWFNAEQIVIENINWNDFSFLPKITSKIYFKYYSFDFYKYNDNDNIIFDSINNIKWPLSININFYSKLDWENTLINTFNKINNVIDEIVYNNSVIDKSNNKIDLLSIHWFDTFLNTYYLSKDELDIITNMKIDTFINRLNIEEDNFNEDYIINYLNNTKINNFSFHFINYSKRDWKIYKADKKYVEY